MDLQGDFHTAYFHRVVQIRRSRNHIARLSTSDGRTISNPDEIIKEFANFYVSLWATPPVIDTQAIRNLPWPEIELADSNALRADFSPRRILMSLAPAPGPDGFTAQFFQKAYSWSPFHAFHARVSQDGISAPRTHLCFVPKCNNPSMVMVRDFRPIALCNLSYRVLAKRLLG